jgi:diguanylate cyclase (GGDEF)-like protein/PAS domain S-box-containing protein
MNREHPSPLEVSASAYPQDSTWVSPPVLEAGQGDPRFWHTFQNAAIGMAVLDESGKLLESNPALSQVLGYSPAEFQALSFVDFTHPDDIALDWGLFQELTNGKRQRYQIEKRYYRKDGKLIWGRLTVSVSRKPEGLAFVLGMVEDITERKQVEAALRHSEQRFQSVFEDSPLGIAMIDEHCRVLQMNAALCELLGYSKPELVGSSLLQITHPTDAEAERSNFDKLIKGDLQSFQIDKRCARTDGSDVWVNLTASGVRGTDGEFLYGLAIVKDTTQRRNAEQRLAFQAHHDLLTGLPNRLLLKDRLQQAIAFARRHDRIVGIFCIDLDGFKTVNDSLGHLKGDILLQEVAKRLVAVVREVDTLARTGGDEFVLVVTDLRTLDDAKSVASRILDTLSPCFLLDGRELFVTASIGISVYPFHGPGNVTLLRGCRHVRGKAGGKERLHVLQP